MCELDPKVMCWLWRVSVGVCVWGMGDDKQDHALDLSISSFGLRMRPELFQPGNLLVLLSCCGHRHLMWHLRMPGNAGPMKEQTPASLAWGSGRTCSLGFSSLCCLSKSAVGHISSELSVSYLAWEFNQINDFFCAASLLKRFKIRAFSTCPSWCSSARLLLSPGPSWSHYTCVVPTCSQVSPYLFWQFTSLQRCSLSQWSYQNPTNLWDCWNFSSSMKSQITLKMMSPELLSSHYFLAIHYVCLCLSNIPTKIHSWSLLFPPTLSPARWVPRYGTQHW